jgi:protein-tyrosine sulfotransferase
MATDEQTKALEPGGTPPAWSKIFILSLPRSGSTLLRLILDTHPKICCPGELNLGQLCEDLYQAVNFTIGQARTPDESERPELVTEEVRRIVNGLMTTYAGLKGKPIWAEKSPKNMQYLKRLRQVFPDAAYVCLYRDLIDLANSAIESNRFGRLNYEMWGYENIFENCVTQTSDLMAFERENRGQCHRIKYEDVVLAPAETLKGLFAFLGVDYDESLPERVFTASHDTGPGDPKAAFASRIYTSSIGKGSRQRVDSLVPEPWLTKMRRLMAELGYGESGAGATVSQTAAAGVGGGAQLSRVEEVFNTYLPMKLSRDHASISGVSGTLKLVVKGDHGGTWKIDFGKSPARIVAADEDADCTIMVKSADLIKMANGELNAGECFLQAKIRVTGNEILAFRLGQLLFN